MSIKTKDEQEKALKRVRHCTHMAVTHLTQGLNPDKPPKTPQLRLLHDMCFHFYKSCQYELLLGGYIRQCILDGDIIRIIPMELLDMIRLFYDIRYDIFELLNTKEHQPQPELEPIVEIGVCYPEARRNEKPEPPYEMLKRSVSGKDGDIAIHGNRKTYLYFKRADDKYTGKPITAITIMSRNYNEEVQ